MTHSQANIKPTHLSPCYINTCTHKEYTKIQFHFIRDQVCLIHVTNFFANDIIHKVLQCVVALLLMSAMYKRHNLHRFLTYG